MRVSIIGTGYVGLVSGVCLAEIGHQVVCVDVDAAKVDRINDRSPPIHERGLPELLRRHVGTNFRATTDLREAVLGSDISMIAVGTPFGDQGIDLRFIREVARQIGAVLRDKPGYHVVVVKSTVVPGTTDDVVLPLLEEASGKTAGRDFGVGMNPEFLREGEAVQDFLHPDRIVLGALDERTGAVMAELYSGFAPVDTLMTSPRTAEAIKYTANALLATMISFSNEIGNLCATIEGVDVIEVMRGVHLDQRLSPIQPDGRRVVPGFVSYLEAGCGFGGSCFPKDVKALSAFGKSVGVPMRLLDATIEVNTLQPKRVLALLAKHFPALAGVEVAVLGLAFKPGTDDVRESPAIPVVTELLARGARVRAFDPEAMLEARRIFEDDEGLTFAASVLGAVEGAQAIVVLTRWPEFADLPRLLQDHPAPPVVIDGRRMLPAGSIERYEGVGLGPIRGASAVDEEGASGGAAVVAGVGLLGSFEDRQGTILSGVGDLIGGFGGVWASIGRIPESVGVGEIGMLREWVTSVL